MEIQKVLHLHITQEELHKLLSYNKITGVFTWAVSLNTRIQVGSIAGSTTKLGYTAIKIHGKVYLAHRLAWLYIYGNLPDIIDHIDGDPSNNGIANLREASHKTNGYNTKISKSNKVGIKGIQFRDGRYPRYRATIKIDGVAYSKSLQANAYDKDTIISILSGWLQTMRTKHGEFANHG